MKRRKKTTKPPETGLDTYRQKRGRGRPRLIEASEVLGRAQNYRKLFWQYRLDKRKQEWVRDRPYDWAEKMLAAKSEDELREALKAAPNYAQGEFGPFLGLMLSILGEKTFPKSTPAQLDYLADSLAGLGRVTPRSSRDICGTGRATARRLSRFKIVRYEYYVECTCGYKGPARDGACRKCGAQIPILEKILWGTGFD